MDAASGDAVAIFPDIDIDFDLDGFDFDLAADEFCVAGGDDGDYFVAAAADKKSAVPALDLGSPERDGGSGREGSPDSVVTDGPLAPGDGSMSAYVSELERFLMEDDGERTVEDLAADEYFNDLLADREDVFPVTDAGGNAEDDEEELAAHEDEATSRKRARKGRGTAVTTPSEELEVAGRHLDRFRVPAPWLISAPALLLCGVCT